MTTAAVSKRKSAGNRVMRSTLWRWASAIFCADHWTPSFCLGLPLGLSFPRVLIVVPINRLASWLVVLWQLSAFTPLKPSTGLINPGFNRVISLEIPPLLAYPIFWHFFLPLALQTLDSRLALFFFTLGAWEAPAQHGSMELIPPSLFLDWSSCWWPPNWFSTIAGGRLFL